MPEEGLRSRTEERILKHRGRPMKRSNRTVIKRLDKRKKLKGQSGRSRDRRE
jgi:hypothetical protein